MRRVCSRGTAGGTTTQDYGEDNRGVLRGGDARIPQRVWVEQDSVDECSGGLDRVLMNMSLSSWCELVVSVLDVGNEDLRDIGYWHTYKVIVSSRVSQEAMNL
jgi:hypothetical protein